jgi:type II secretory pathway component GspD/PulD (secretin)
MKQLIKYRTHTGNVSILIHAICRIRVAFYALTVLSPIHSFSSTTQDVQENAKPAINAIERRAYIRDSLRQVRLQERRKSGVEIQRKKSSNTSAPAVLKTASQGNTSPSSDIATTKVTKAVELPIADSIMVEDLSIRNTNIQDVLAALAIQHKVNILVDKDVSSNISINLSNIPLKKAIPLIVLENGFDLEVVHGAIKVKRRDIVTPIPKEIPLHIFYEKGKLSIDIQNIPVEKMVRQLVDVSGKNIVLDPNTRGNITAYFKDLPFDQGVQLLAESNGLKTRTKKGVLQFYKNAWVGSNNKGGQRYTNITLQNNLISMEVHNAPLQDVVASITSQGGLSAVIYGQLSGAVTAKLENVSIPDALGYLFRGTDFTFWLDEDIYFIGSRNMQAITNSKLIVLKHMKADEIMALIPPDMTQNMELKLVPSQNAIMTLGTYEAIQSLESYIDKIDLPVAQILIEALVVDIDMDKFRKYGINLFRGSRSSTSNSSFYPNYRVTLGKEETESLLSGIPGLRDVVSLPKDFLAQIEALEEDKVLKVKSRPQIATLNGKTASITVGQTQYFLLESTTDVNSGNAGTTTRSGQKFQTIQADVKFTVTPFVTGKGEITTEITPDFSEPEGSFSSGAPPTINRRVLKSTVRLREGETIILGGLVKETKSKGEERFPLLSSIPLLGWFFKNRTIQYSRSQLMIFVTPYIYYGKDAHVNVTDYMKEIKNSLPIIPDK